MIKKILLAIVPFWSPLIPPMGIARLKSYIRLYGYTVKTVDLNVEESFKQLYKRYFELIKKYIPLDRRGNLHNIGHDVMQNHMMAHLNLTDEERYGTLVKELFYQYYFIHIPAPAPGEFHKVLDDFYNRLKDYAAALLEKERPDALGLTVYCGNLPASLFMFKLAKKLYPHIKTIMGGGIFSQQLAVSSPNFEDFLDESKPYLDKIMIGEGEKLLLKYLRGELDDSQRVYTLKNIKEGPLNLREVRLPDLSDFDLNTYAYVGVTGSRSCTNKCAFCNSRIFWGEYERRDPASTAEEMVTLYRKHGFRLFYMSDAQVNPVVTDLARELIKREAPLYFDAYLRVHEPGCGPVSDIQNTLMWRRGGFYRARIGCETGSRRILDMIGKNATVEHIKGAITSLAYAGMKTTTYWIVGFPGETEEDFQQTLSLVDELKNDIYQAECAAFIYYYDGQNRSDEWAKWRKLLFPPETKDMLLTRTWILDCEPRRDVIYDRLNRFVKHITRLGIPNPFSLHEIHKADERWKKLQKNAVPSLLEIDTKKDRDSRRDIKNVNIARDQNRYEIGGFNF